MLTVYGIETYTTVVHLLYCKTLRVATVLTVYGIETILFVLNPLPIRKVATVLTVYGIETTY